MAQALTIIIVLLVWTSTTTSTEDITLPMPCCGNGVVDLEPIPPGSICIISSVTEFDKHLKAKYSRPIPYYRNSNCTFQLDLCEFGDIHPHPGPARNNTNVGLDDNSSYPSPYSIIKDAKGLKFISLNICSLYKKIDELRLIVLECKPDVISLMETKINDSICSTELNIQNYDLYRRDRTRHGGGIAVYIRSQLQYTVLSPRLPDSSETMWFNISLPCTRPIIFGAVYRSQIEGDFLITFEGIMHDILPEINNNRRRSTAEIICMGDFNYDGLKRNSSEWKELERTMSTFQLNQIITKPTRVTEQSKSCIDHVWTNNPHLYSQWGVVSCTLSDHSMIYTARKSVKLKAKATFIEARSYRKFNQTAFVQDLNKEQWQSVFDCSNVDQAWDNFSDILLPICAPIKKVRVTDQQPTWIDEEYLELRRTCQKARAKAEKTSEPEDWARAKMLRNNLNYRADKLKSQYINDSIDNSKNNPGELWTTLKTLLPGKKQNSINCLSTDNGTVTSEEDIANTVNTFFSTVGQNLASKFN